MNVICCWAPLCCHLWALLGALLVPRPALFPSPAADRQAIDPGSPGLLTVHSPTRSPTQLASPAETANQPQAQQGLLFDRRPR